MNDALIYEYVLDEVESEQYVKSLWAKAMAHSDGSPDKTKALYMQYRVNALKEEFELLGIDYSALGLEELTNLIGNLLLNSAWREIKINEKITLDQDQKLQEKLELQQQEKNAEEQAKQEVLEKEQQKYGKISGWLLPLAFFLVLWAITAIIYPLLTVTKGMDDIKQLLLAGGTEFVQIMDWGLYTALVGQFFLLLFAIFFFKKLKGTRAVAITFFVAVFVLNLMDSILIFGFRTVDFGQFKGSDLLESGDLGRAILLPFFTFILSTVSIIYFAKSKRVKKTFTKVRLSDKFNNQAGHFQAEKSNVDLFFYAALLPIILLISYENAKPSVNDLADSISKQAETALTNKNYDEADSLYSKAPSLSPAGLNDKKIGDSFFDSDQFDKAYETYKGLGIKENENLAEKFYSIAFIKRQLPWPV